MKYEVLRPLATGGMAEIHLARARDSGRLVVLKKLHPRLAIEREYVQMFRDEAVIASMMQHPNLVEIYELGLEGDEHYIAMEFLHGHDLSRTLRKMRHEKVPLMFQQAITIVRDIAAGLHYAHEKLGDDGNPLNIIHRDISPHNIILTYSGEVKVVDFGIAKANSQVAKTRTGVLKGKAAYMSPEQAMGEAVDRRTDVFGMGILLWELTTGRWLYRRRSELETLKAVVETDAPRPSTLNADYPKDLEKILMKALERTPAKRWSTAGELRGALDELARSWKFRPQPLLIAKLMAQVFPERATKWEAARDAGISLGDHLVAAGPDAVEIWEDTIGTDPDEAVALETRRAPMESSGTGPVEAIVPDKPAPSRRSHRPTQQIRAAEARPELQSSSSRLQAAAESWWIRNLRFIVAGAVAVAVAVGIAIVAALVLGGEDGRARPRPTRGSGARDQLPQTETLQIGPAQTDTEPKPDPAPPPAPPPSSGPTPETKVPIVHPPPLPESRKPAHGSSHSSSHSPETGSTSDATP